jgi:hypothetical protein
MKRIVGCLLIIILLAGSCSLQSEIPNTDLDVATHFIRSIQRNKFRDARKLMLINETNLQYLDRFETHFHTKPKEELLQLRDAEIIVNEVSNVSDSVTIVNYSNSFNKAEKNKVKMVRLNGQWLVDLQYTFSGNL